MILSKSEVIITGFFGVLLNLLGAFVAQSYDIINGLGHLS
jgi:hypothetical protein